MRVEFNGQCFLQDQVRVHPLQNASHALSSCYNSTDSTCFSGIDRVCMELLANQTSNPNSVAGTQIPTECFTLLNAISNYEQQQDQLY